MSNTPAVRELPAPRSASAARRGAAVELIVLHSDPRAAELALAAFGAPASPAAPHYHVAAGGAVTRLVPESRAARHSGYATWRRRRRSIDRISVGVTLENEAGAPYEVAQLDALGQLVADIATRYGLGADDVVAWAPPEPGERSGMLEQVYLPSLLPEPAAPADTPAAPVKSRPGSLGGEEDEAAERLWLALQSETYRRRGGIDFQPGWAFHLHASQQGLGAPLAPSAPSARRVKTGDGAYGYQPFARDTLFHRDQDWTGIQGVSQLASGAMPAAGTLAFLLLQQSYEDALAAGPQPPAGKVGFKPEQAMPQLAHKERLGPALSGNYQINVAGAAYAVQVFAGDTLYTPIAPAGKPTNWGVVRRLSQEPPGALRTALWTETAKVSGAPYNPQSPLQQLAEREKLGAPLGAVARVSVDGKTYEAQVFALDTVYALPGQAPERLSALPKPDAVTGWKPTPPRAAAPAPRAATATTFSQPPGEQRSPAWPTAPGFQFLQSTAERERLFGKYAYRTNPDRTVTITDGWDAANIVDVPTPMLAHLRVPKIRFHRKAAAQLAGLLGAWAQAGLIDRVISWDGTFVPRMMRKLDFLSAHSWGTAFDINARHNGQGVTPPLVGQQGCVRELVAIANDFGFYWGGHFTRDFVDGMHFEVAVLK